MGRQKHSDDENYRRIWQKIEPGHGGCLIWTGTVDPFNRPILGNLRVRRFLWTYSKRPLPSYRTLVRECPTPLCVNALHLRIDTIRKPTATVVDCLRCGNPFRSWDRRKNRICESCRDVNQGLAGGLG